MTRARTAMVLAAGYGARMRPLTDTLPKPLVKLAGRALVDHVLDRLAAAGVETAIVNVHYLPEQVEAHMQERSGRAPKTIISDERDVLLDTGGGAKKALPQLGPGPFFIHNSDSVWAEGAAAALPHMLRQWDATRMDCLLLLAPMSTSLGYHARGDFDMAPDGHLTRRGERQVVPFAFAGVSLCEAKLFDGAPDGPFSLNLLWDQALAKGRLYGLRLDGRWMHVGTPEALAEAEASFEHEGA
ncbi:mannose-1-phosphate guanylyltransferase [Methyloceanibacter superfactus]|jgi:N-acetyl-alpha-D-muramate 1-phosphate uridylyltransferase|uniref:Mannose-1-phosphate guanylyltransferase n=1 Tax=Methyloceanibacter superfactus TaxID=1774969 RepID=A0A1E3W8D3_9HYPH|nr:nucleotidyltransferase family protein [Methyloceanibacter superfactus]ODS01752.1 mannose-1-phosphate guanylyltransferase [Methyloceanibacter superfactus]